VIKSFKGKKTQALTHGQRVKQLEPIARQAEKRLRLLEAAESLKDLANLPSNRLERLSGNRKHQYSIRINNQWRICFEWPEESDGPENVEIIDYH
jgi:proteic killer suppression protein